jgi:phosphoribosylamine--glycine ligase
MLPVQDHKRIGEGDIGPNTGGMGAYAPTGAFTPKVAARVDKTILQPLQDALRKEKLDYRGCLYIGLMLTPDGSGGLVPKVIEFNARFGDPETQVLMPLLKSDLFKVLCACAQGNLEGTELEWSAESAVCVVMASQGYPGDYSKGHVIEEEEKAGIASVAKDVEQNSWVFHAGTAENGQGKILTAGGRVLGVTAKGATFKEALSRAYTRVGSVRFEGCVFRRDIAHRELERRKEI